MLPPTWNPDGYTDVDVHLKPTSPCVNRGTLYAPLLPATDQDGRLRVSGLVPDMGAYELPFAIAQIKPAYARAGSGDILITLPGQAYAPGVKLLWNSSARPATLRSKTKVEALLKAADLSVPGVFSVQLWLPNGEVTPPVEFRVIGPVLPLGR